jgi:soluble lytic murein transglycosylase
MRHADGQRLFDWATSMTSHGYYNDAMGLAQNSLEQMGGQPISTRVLLLCGLAAYHAADFKRAHEFFERLVREHAGSKAGAEAYFRLGIMEFRAEKWAEAAARFERYLDLDNQTDFELSSMYWSWRAYQKLASPKAQSAMDRLIGRYPLSYYGLRARAESAQGHLTLTKDFTEPVRYAIALRASDAAAWERFLLLAKAGWFDEARAELSSLTPPTSAEGQLIFAELWSMTHDFQKSAELLTKAFEKNPDYVTLSAVKIIYPTDYKDDIEKEAKRYNIPVELVQALIKQESSFRTDAKSPAGAIGLMQLMPVTAREVASDMRIKLNDLPSELSKAQVNIRLGSQYLHRRLRAFDDYVPLALASYNAGIGNIRTWLKSRADLKDLSKTHSSAPETELWYDELPWQETSGYIKGILRNLLMYRLLDQGEYQLTDPVWRTSEKTVE